MIRARPALFSLLLLMTPSVAEAETVTISDDKLIVEAKLPTASYGLARGFDSLWSMQGSDLLRIDPDDNGITKSPLPAPDLGSAPSRWVKEQYGCRMETATPSTRSIPPIAR